MVIDDEPVLGSDRGRSDDAGMGRTDDRGGVLPVDDETLAVMLELAPDAMIVYDAEGSVVAVNDVMAELFGYPRETMPGQSMSMLVPRRIYDIHRASYRAIFTARAPRRVVVTGHDLYGLHRDGREFPVEVSRTPIELGGQLCVLSAVRDITERRRDELDASHFAAVVESSHDAIIGKDLDGVILSWNYGAERLYGYSAADAVGRSIALVVPVGHEDEVPFLLARVRAGERIEDHETVALRSDGTHVDVSMTVSPILDRDGNVVGTSTIARDITAQLRYQKQLRFLAEHDALTGVRNRRRFERDVSEQVDRAHRFGEHAALLMIDVDRFKHINDSHGHRTGDRALKLIARTLASRVHDSDMLARIGGDEFAALLPYADARQAQVVAESLCRAIAALELHSNEGIPIRLSISVGVALIDERTTSDELVLAEADRTMYRRKAGCR